MDMTAWVKQGTKEVVGAIYMSFSELGFYMLNVTGIVTDFVDPK